mmetsp:Transcript_9380/g.16920  ORF Transcript_9380/g.16920 Transcript_9380/m.16920 type:complete len:90 (-) Transcript_9380:242-511(-)
MITGAPPPVDGATDRGAAGADLKLDPPTRPPPEAAAAGSTEEVNSVRAISAAATDVLHSDANEDGFALFSSLVLVMESEARDECRGREE